MAKETKNNKEKKVKGDKKPFLKDFKSELKKVIWPTPKQLFNSTSTVIIIVLLTAALVFVLDFCFDKGYQFVIDKADKIVQKNEDNSTNSTTEEENVESDDSVVTVDEENASGQTSEENQETTEQTTENSDQTAE